MNTSRDMEPTNGNEVVSPPFSKPIATHKSGNHSPTFLNIMKKTVLHHKIPYWNANETKGDGNCFYNAIIDPRVILDLVYDCVVEAVAITFSFSFIPVRNVVMQNSFAHEVHKICRVIAAPLSHSQFWENG